MHIRRHGQPRQGIPLLLQGKFGKTVPAGRPTTKRVGKWLPHERAAVVVHVWPSLKTGYFLYSIALVGANYQWRVDTEKTADSMKRVSQLKGQLKGPT